MAELYNTESPIDRKRRNNINATWDDILSRFANLQRQINILAGGQEVDDLISRLEQAIKAAEIDVQNYIIQVDESVQQAINENNNALQTALQTVSETLDELNIAISKAETATEDATNAKNATIQATQDARDAINTMQSLIDNFSHRGNWSTTTQYYKNNLVEVDGRTYIALKENINTPVTNKSTWALFADKGAQGAEGPRGLPGKDGKDGTGVNIIGGLTSEDELPAIGTPGDAYMIGGDLYVWQDDTGSWKNVGPIQGPEGKSAYDLAVENGFEGTMEEWIESLKGEIGPQGPEGPPGPPGKDADLTEVTEQLEQMKPKVDNSWQKGVYNNTDITNLGAKNATKTILIADTDWKGTTNVEVAQIVLPLRRFSGLIKVSFASTWINFNAGGGAEVVYQIFKVTSTTHVNNMIINNISSQFAEAYRIQGAAITESGIVLSIVKSPQAKNTVVVKIELLSVFDSGDNDVFNALKNTTVEMADIGLPPVGGYPWTPQKSEIDSKFPLNTTRANNADLNTYKTNGVFALGDGLVNGVTPSHYGAYSTLYVSTSADVVTQLLVDYLGNSYTRAGAGAGTTNWHDWKRLLTQDDYDQLFTSVSEGKADNRATLAQRGVIIPENPTFAQISQGIRDIPTGVKYANFEVPVPVIAPNGTTTITTPAMNFQPRNSTSTLIGAYIYQGFSGDLSGAPYIQVTFATKYTINNLGNGNYTISITIKNPMSINGGNQNHGFTFTG